MRWHPRPHPFRDAGELIAGPVSARMEAEVGAEGGKTLDRGKGGALCLQVLLANDKGTDGLAVFGQRCVTAYYLLTIAFLVLARATARALKNPLAADCTSMVSAARMNCTASEVSGRSSSG